MAFRKRTLRGMMPVVREGAKLLNELDSVRRRMRLWLAKVEDAESIARAYASYRMRSEEGKVIVGVQGVFKEEDAGKEEDGPVHGDSGGGREEGGRE